MSFRIIDFSNWSFYIRYCKGGRCRFGIDIGTKTIATVCATTTVAAAIFGATIKAIVIFTMLNKDEKKCNFKIHLDYLSVCFIVNAIKFDLAHCKRMHTVPGSGRNVNNCIHRLQLSNCVADQIKRRQ